MGRHRTAYELARSQVVTPLEIIQLFWRITHRYRSHFSRVLDLGAGDGRFARSGRFASYEGVEIDTQRPHLTDLPGNAKVLYHCAFEHEKQDYAACIGNPPYVRHHDIDERWRDSLARRLTAETGVTINRKCNLYVYFLFLALLKSISDGLVSVIVPYEWVSRPSAGPLRKYINNNKWHVDVYKFVEPIFDGVLTTASISVIDKRKRDGQWCYYQIDRRGAISQVESMTGSNRVFLPYENRGKLWAMRGMSPGTQKVFTLTEGERIHAGLEIDDVLPCVTSLRAVPRDLAYLNISTFREWYVLADARCWLIKSYMDVLTPRLKDYVDSVPEARRNTWTCNSREPWHRYSLFEAPRLLVSTGFTTFGPKILVNSVGAHAVGSVCGVYSDAEHDWGRLRGYLIGVDFENRVVPHARKLKKIEIRQLNTVLNSFSQWKERHA